MAARLEVSPSTLRRWSEEFSGFLSPETDSSEGKQHRGYSDEDLERLGLIQELTAEGVNLEGVRRILELQSENNRLRSQVDRLRRLLGEAQSRTGADMQPTQTFRVNVTRRRNLPDIVRDTPFGES